MKKSKIVTIKVFEHAGNFAENKDIARKIRVEYLLPALSEGNEVVLDYSGIDSTTQSFTHALISDAIRTYGRNVLDRISFKDCGETVKKIISIVVEYMQRNSQ